MITYIRSVDKWKIKPTPQTIPCCRIKKRNILANQAIFYVDKRYISAFYQHNPQLIDIRV